VGKKQLFPQNWIGAFACAFLRDVLFVRWGSLISSLCAGGEKQNFFVSVSIFFLQVNLIFQFIFLLIIYCFLTYHFGV